MGCNTSKETATNQNEKTKNGGDEERDGVVEDKHVDTGKFKWKYQFQLRYYK